MPFCTQCGKQVSPADAYCGNCGSRQPGMPGGRGFGNSSAPTSDPLAGLSPRTAAILCYVPTVGWIAAVIVLASRKFKGDRVTRFHAFQGLYLFAAWLVVSWVIRPMFLAAPEHFIRIDHILEALLLAVSIFMMIKASHNEPYALPIVGELAQRSATEQ